MPEQRTSLPILSFTAARTQRIVSIVPSQTELLFDLGLDKEVVGITKFCVHPQTWFRSKTRIGGTKNLQLAAIHALQPDLVLANKEENERAQVEELAKAFPVHVTDVNDLPGALQMITDVGRLVHCEEKANRLAENIAMQFQNLHTPKKRLRTAYLIWKNPYMSVGGDTFIHDMLRRAGLQNVLAGKQRYPQVIAETLEELNPELVLLSSEPYPFKKKDADELRRLLPRAKVVLVDGELFSWYGSRLLYTADYLMKLGKEINAMH